jgi:Kef-type K+ transport system membrane component KefB
VDDAISWAFLALVVALLSSSSPLTTLYIIIAALVFTGLMLGVARPLFVKLYRKVRSNERTPDGNLPGISQTMVIVSFVVTMISSFITSIIGIHTIFGGFITGLSLPRENGFAIALTHRLEDFVSLILLPLYFAYSGLRTDIGSLSDGLSWGCFFLAFFSAAAGKIGGCTLAARATGSSWREAFTIGVMMNTKGLVEIIVLNIGLDAGMLVF